MENKNFLSGKEETLIAQEALLKLMADSSVNLFPRYLPNTFRRKFEYDK